MGAGSSSRHPQGQLNQRRYGGEGGILFHEALKFPVLMVKTNPDRVKRYLRQNLFYRCHWEI